MRLTGTNYERVYENFTLLSLLSDEQSTKQSALPYTCSPLYDYLTCSLDAWHSEYASRKQSVHSSSCTFLVLRALGSLTVPSGFLSYGVHHDFVGNDNLRCHHRRRHRRRHRPRPR
jgi:hypothetical protein